MLPTNSSLKTEGNTGNGFRVFSREERAYFSCLINDKRIYRMALPIAYRIRGGEGMFFLFDKGSKDIQDGLRIAYRIRGGEGMFSLFDKGSKDIQDGLRIAYRIRGGEGMFFLFDDGSNDIQDGLRIAYRIRGGEGMFFLCFVTLENAVHEFKYPGGKLRRDNRSGILLCILRIF